MMILTVGRSHLSALGFRVSAATSKNSHMIAMMITAFES